MSSAFGFGVAVGSSGVVAVAEVRCCLGTGALGGLVEALWYQCYFYIAWKHEKGGDVCCSITARCFPAAVVSRRAWEWPPPCPNSGTESSRFVPLLFAICSVACHVPEYIFFSFKECVIFASFPFALEIQWQKCRPLSQVSLIIILSHYWFFFLY